MTVALAGRVQDALAGLEPDARRALELREREERSYSDIAAELGVRRENVADLLVAARLAVRAHVRDTPLPKRRSAQCGPARRVMAAQQDNEPVGGGDVDRLREHLAGCESCRDARRDLREAALACAAWRRTDPAEAAARPLDEGNGARGALAAGRRRLAVVAAAAVVVVVLLIAVLSGGGRGVDAPAAPKPLPGSAKGSGKDIVPPPGEQFCAQGEQGCRP